MSATAQAIQKSESKQPLIVQYLQRYRSQIEAALPRHMTPDRMARIVTTEIRKVPQLLQCNPKSLFGAVIQAAQLGLEPGSALGHCYLIPYGKDVNLIIGYRGMIELARRSGQIVSIEARCVYANDEFRFSFGLKPELHHVPASGDRGELTHVYAVAHLKGGGVQWEVMTKDEVDQIKAMSPAAKRKDSPWNTHFSEMARKTVIRRLFKYLPVSVEIQTAVTLDEQADAGVPQRNDTVIEGEFMDLGSEPVGEEQPKTKTAEVKAKLKGKAQDAQPAPLRHGNLVQRTLVGMIHKAAAGAHQACTHQPGEQGRQRNTKPGETHDISC